jgi:hypothetical protein
VSRLLAHSTRAWWWDCHLKPSSRLFSVGIVSLSPWRSLLTTRQWFLLYWPQEGRLPLPSTLPYRRSTPPPMLSLRTSPYLDKGPVHGRLRLKCDVTHTETRFRLSAKRTSPFKSAGVSVQSTTGSPGMRISSSNAGCTMSRGSVKSTGYPLHSPVSPSIPLPCVTVCHHISTWLYYQPGQLDKGFFF